MQFGSLTSNRIVLKLAVPETMIPLASPDIRDEDITEVIKVLRSGMLVQSDFVSRLEQGFSKYLDGLPVVAVSNGTATLHLALLAAGIGEGDEVIVPSFSYIATANAVELAGARPVFVDIELSTFCIDADLIEDAISPMTKAIIPVHEFGLMADMTRIMSIAEEHDLIVIEDAACALGASEHEKRAGTFGHFGSFSLHPRKIITSGEGGLLSCKSKDHAEIVRILRNHGLSEGEGKKEFTKAGFNYRLTDLQAALARSQFERLEEILVRRSALAEIYLDELVARGIELPSCPRHKRHTWQSFQVLLDDDINRDEVMTKLLECGVGSNIGAQCLPNERFYREKYCLDVKELFPNGLRANKHGLVLPLYEKLMEDEVLQVCHTLLHII